MEIGTGDHCAGIYALVSCQHLVIAGVIGKDHGTVFPGDHHSCLTALILGKLQIHSHLLGIAFRPIHGRTKGNDRAPIYIGTKIRVQACVCAGICGGDNHTPIDHQIAVGVNAITFCAQTGDDMDITAVDGGDRHTVFIGVDAVIIGTDGNIAAIDSQVQLGIQAFVIGSQIQLARSKDIHGHIGVDSTILLPQFLLSFFFFENLGNMGAVYHVFTFQN